MAHNGPNSPPHVQRNIFGIPHAIKLDYQFGVLPQLEPLDVTEYVYSQAAVLLTQQILFMQHFPPTDAIFYGDRIDSEDPRDSYPTVRMAMVDAPGMHFLPPSTQTKTLSIRHI